MEKLYFFLTHCVLTVLFCGKQIILQIVELALPKIQRLMATKSATLSIDIHASADDNVLSQEQIAAREEEIKWISRQAASPQFGDGELGGCLMDYNEMVIQFGFMTLFAVSMLYSCLIDNSEMCDSIQQAAFPGGAFFALLNNIQEIRSDAKILVEVCQRPAVSIREDIGAWSSMLETISYVSVVTNALIIGFTAKVSYGLVYDVDVEDSTIPHLGERYESYSLWIMVAIVEHVIIVLKTIIGKLPQKGQECADAELALAEYANKPAMLLHNLLLSSVSDRYVHDIFIEKQSSGSVPGISQRVLKTEPRP